MHIPSYESVLNLNVQFTTFMSVLMHFKAPKIAQNQVHAPERYFFWYWAQGRKSIRITIFFERPETFSFWTRLFLIICTTGWRARRQADMYPWLWTLLTIHMVLPKVCMCTVAKACKPTMHTDVFWATNSTYMYFTCTMFCFYTQLPQPHMHFPW